VKRGKKPVKQHTYRKAVGTLDGTINEQYIEHQKQKENSQDVKVKNKVGAKVTRAFMLHVLISRLL
jgi:hypothetical protein